MKHRPLNLHAHEARAAAKGELRKVFRIVKPQPSFPFGVNKIVSVPDVFHDDAFKGTPAEGLGNKGVRQTKLYCEDYSGNLVAEFDYKCPCGVVGDRLWGREVWEAYELKPFVSAQIRSYAYPAVEGSCVIEYQADKEKSDDEKSDDEWRSLTRMPRWASRFLFSIEDISVMRIQDVTESAIIEAGCPKEYLLGQNWLRYEWGKIHGKDAWTRNEWVWALTLKNVVDE